MENKDQNEREAVERLSALKQKVENLLSLDKITRDDTIDFNEIETDYLCDTVNSRLKQLTDVARDVFIEKIAPIMPPSTKRDVWESNNAVISHALSKLIETTGTMPSKSTLANETGLSRQTIAKHLEDYKHNPNFVAGMNQFKFLTPRIVANIYKTALKGDTKAARLYLETVGSLNRNPGNNTVVNEQTNNIQINNTILSQENLKRLSKEQLEQIERIITNGATSYRSEVARIKTF